MTSDIGHVFGSFESAFDFQGTDSGLGELRDEVDSGEVLGTQQVLAVAERNLVAIGDELVGHAAGLGTFAAIGGTSSEGFARETLAAVGDAQGSMNENLQRKAVIVGLVWARVGVEFLLYFADFDEGTFTCEHRDATPELLCETDCSGAGDRHLGGGMDGEVWGDLPDQPAESDILNDRGIDPCCDDQPEGFFCLLDFGGKDQGV